jgi:propanediol dehydratase large subunit
LKSTTALLSRVDRDRIRRFITLHEVRLAREQEVLALLSARVERARIAGDSEVPQDVVTMYSQRRMALRRRSAPHPH